MADRKRLLLQWWMLPATVTGLLLLFNSPWFRVHYPEIYRLKQWVYGLSLEMNFAVWWSSVLYLLSAALFYEIASGEQKGRRRPYVELSLLMLAVMIDEVGSLHERISGFGGWPSLAPFGLLLAALLVDGLRLLWREREARPAAWMVLAGFVLLASVAGQEYAEHNLTSRQWSEWWGRFLEETTELVGALLILAGAVYRRGGRRWNAPPSALVPDPSRMTGLLPLVLGGLVAHGAAAQVLYLPKVGPPHWYGSPAAIYPLIVFFLLACSAWWRPLDRKEALARHPEIRGFWIAAGLFFLACSVGTMQNLWGLVGRVVPGLGRRWFYEPIPMYLAMILVVWFIALALLRRYRWRLLWLAALPLTPLVQLRLEHLAASHLATGLFAFLCAMAFLRPAGDPPLRRGAAGS